MYFDGVSETNCVSKGHGLSDAKRACPTGVNIVGSVYVRVVYVRVFRLFFFLFFITLKARVKVLHKYMSLQYEPALEPQHICVK